MRTPTTSTIPDSANWFRNLFEANPHPMWVYDLPSLRFLAVNDAAVAHYGYSHAEFLQMTIADIRPAEEVPRLLDNVRATSASTTGGLDQAGVWRHRTKDGRVLDVQIVSHTIEFDGRNAKLVLATDITALRASEERYALAERAVNDGLWDWNVLTHEAYLAPRWKEILGYQDNELPNSDASFFDNLHPDDVAAVTEAVRAHLEDQQRYAIEFRVKHKDGNYRWVLSRGEAVRDAAGKAIRMVGAITDITERKRVEQTLAIQGEILTAVTEALAAYVEHGDWRKAMGRLLRTALAQTQSEYGFIGVVEGAALRVLAHEGLVWDQVLNRDFYEQALRRYEELGYLEFTNFENLFGRAITTGQAIIANAPDSDSRSAGRPSGHPPMHSFLGVPIFVGQQVQGVVALANRADGYSEEDQRRIETLVQHAGGLCASYRQNEAARLLEQQRLQSEGALRVSEERLRLAVHASNVGLWDWNLDTNEVAYSREWKSQLGYAEHEIANHFNEWQSRVHPDDLAATLEQIRLNLAGQIGPRGVEFRMRHKDGSWHWIFSRGEVFRDADGKPVRMLGGHVDVTERKLAEEVLRKSQASLEAAQARVHIGSWEIDPQTDAGTWSREMYRIFQRDPTLGMPPFAEFLEMVHVEDRDAVKAATARALKTGALVNVDFRTNPERLPLRYLTATFESATRVEGRTILMAGTTQDITERKQTENELRISEQSNSTLLKNLSGMVYRCRNDADWTLEFISDGCFDMTGYRADELRHNRVISLGALIHADDVQPIWEKCQINLDAHRPCSNEYRIVHRNGEVRWVWDQAQGVYANDGKLLAVEGLITDITLRKQTEASHAALEAQLRQAQKMEAMGQLAGGIAHDFNNLLAAIVGNAALAQMDLTDAHPALTSIKEIQRAGQRAKELVQRILAFSRPQEQRLQPIQLQSVLEEAVRLLRSTLPAGVEMRCASASTLPAVRADASQIHQVIINLATNAWHAMESQAGSIDIGLTACTADSELCHSHPDLQPGAYVRLSVSDTGKGMDTTTLARIFEPFFTTKPPGQGVGLGLSVVHGIVRGHGGAIIVTSQIGKGSTFDLYFPASAEATAASVIEPREQTVPGHGERILFLDDEEPLVFLAVRFLERLGYRVEGYTRAAEALAAFRANPHSYDLVITDYNMPGMSGMEVAQELLRVRPDAPIALASGYVRPAEIDYARTLGIREIILKPNTVEELAPVVQRLLAARAG